MLIIYDLKNHLERSDENRRELMKKGFYAGSGYQMVWARDLNTFIELSCEEYDLNVIRENLLMFFHFQQDNGELLDGYVPREGFNWVDPNTYESSTAPDHIGFKNTVETDQETSLIQAIAKYISKTNDHSIGESFSLMDSRPVGCGKFHFDFILQKSTIIPGGCFFFFFGKRKY